MKKVFFLLLALKCVIISNGQVNLQTGSATFSLPMFNWQDEKSRLNGIVSLEYNSGNGLKVNSVAGIAGQGWGLVAGGVITRIQAGEPDDQKPRDGAVEDITKYPAGFLYDPQSAEDGCPAALTRYPVFGDKNHVYKQHNTVAADKEIDKFSFTFNGRTGIFTLHKGSTDKIVFLGDTRMKGWFVRDESWASSSQQPTRTTIKEFYIQDENGLQYKFSEVERTKILRTQYCGPNLTSPITQPNFKHGRVYYENMFDDNQLVNPWVVTSWYLSEIKDVLTNRVISFSYEDRNIDAYAGASVSHNIDKNYSIVSHRRSISRTPVLKQISYPDGHKVVFDFQDADRVDVAGDKALRAVTVTYRNTDNVTRNLVRYNLKTSYLIQNRFGNPWTEFQARNARLYLLSVQKASADFKAEEEPYVFSYYTGSGANGDLVPGQYSPYKDIWDYYNGGQSRSSVDDNTITLTKGINELNNDELKGLCYLRNGVAGINHAINSGYAKNGLLKQISYPTGGTLEYKYEQNEFYDAAHSQVIVAGGVHVSETASADGNGNCDVKLASKYRYLSPKVSNPNELVSSLWGYEEPDNSISTSSHYEPEDKYFRYRPVFDFSCAYRFQYPGILAKDQALSVPWGVQVLEILSTVMGVVSPILEVMDIVNLITDASWTNVIIDLVAALISIGITCFVSQSRDTDSNIYYNFDIHASNPLPQQFKRVEIRDGATGGMGATVMEFTSSDDYPLWAAENPSLSSKQRYANWAYGLPKRTLIMGESGLPIKETINYYDYNWAQRVYDNDNGIVYFSSCKCLVTEMVSQRSDEWSDPALFNPPAKANFLTSNSGMIVDISQTYGGRVQLERSVEKLYKQNSGSISSETETKYKYHYANYEVTDISTKGSDGKTSFQHFTYSRDYTDGIFGTLATANIVNLPVSVITGFTNPGNDYTFIGTGTYLLKESVTEFAQLGNGDIKVSRTLERRFAQPTNALPAYSGPATTNYSNFKITSELTYNTAGELIATKDEGNRSMVNIYNHNSKFIVATVMNADALVDKPAYTSFENVVAPHGGWTITGSASYSSNNITGKQSLSLAPSNTITAPMNTGKSYRLSFWTVSTNFSVSGTISQSTTGPTINGFTLYEYILASGQSSVTITGNTSIDELRLSPVNSRMKTVAYDELIGKISEADENNRIIYYEYDDRSRLRMIRDDHKNIIKMYEYNVAKKVPCGGIFSHPAITEVFTKSCGANLYSTEYIYTIPAGKYTSTVSQDEVDQAIENELKSTTVLNLIISNTQCLPLYRNTLQQRAFTKEGCEYGYVGSSVTYIVPEGTYTSKESVDKANELALEEIDANGQAYANQTGTCVYSTEAVWIATGVEYCSNGNKFRQVKDLNPHSPTYNTTQTVNWGSDPSCPPPPCTMYDIIVPYSVADNLYIDLYNCGSGYSLKNWLVELDRSEVPDGSKITVCLSQPPAFRYGSNDVQVLIPEIEVISIGSCNP